LLLKILPLAKNILKKYIKVILVILGVLLVLVIGANYYAKLQLKKALSEVSAKNDFSYETLDVNVLLGRVSIDNVNFKSKSFELESPSIKVKGFGYWSYITSKDISVSTLQIDAPKLKVIKGAEKDTVTSTKNQSFKGDISIGNIKTSNGYLDVINEGDEKNISIKLSNINLKSFKTSQEILKNGLPFNYESLSGSLDSVYVKMNFYQDLKVQSIKIEDDDFNVNNLSITPKYERAEFQNVIPYEKDLITLNVPELKLNNLKIDTLNDKLSLKTPSIVVVNADCNIYRDKTHTNDIRIKPMYSEMLRNLNFGLDISALQIQSSKLVYEERAEGTKKIGKVLLENLNAKIEDINNTSKNDGGKLTTANISTNFMGTSQLNVNWQFDINNLNDTFNIKGEAKQVSADAMNMFFVPAVNVKAIGTLNELYFNYSGDKNDALGDMRIDYSTFKVEVLRKDGSSKNRLLSGIVNLFLDNNEKDGRVTKQNVSVTRDKTKSFWNYFWLCIRNGALQSLTKS
jgi:hypothetical protein